MFILETYSDPWNYTFIIVALIAIGIGTFLAIRNMNRDLLKKRREQRSSDNTNISSNKNEIKDINIDKDVTSKQQENQKIDDVNVDSYIQQNQTENIINKDEIDFKDDIKPLKKVNTDKPIVQEELHQVESINTNMVNNIVNNHSKGNNQKNKHNKYYKYHKFYKYNNKKNKNR